MTEEERKQAIEIRDPTKDERSSVLTETDSEIKSADPSKPLPS